MNLDMVHEFIQNYGWYIAAFLLGFIATMIWWAAEHPEDFWKRDESKQDDADEMKEEMR